MFSFEVLLIKNIGFNFEKRKSVISSLKGSFYFTFGGMFNFAMFVNDPAYNCSRKH